VFLCEPLEDQASTPSDAVKVFETSWYSEDELPEDLDPGTGRGYLKPFACAMAIVECFSIGQ